MNFLKTEAFRVIEMPELAILFGSAGLTLVGLYIGWRSFRVFLLRLQLLAVRNAMWDAAHDAHCLEDPIYMQYRSQLNTLIRFAHKVDLPTLALSTIDTANSHPIKIEKASQEIRSSLEHSIDEAATVLNNYILWYRPFTGILFAKLASWAIHLEKKRQAETRRQRQHQLSQPRQRISEFELHPKKSVRKWFQNNGPKQSLAYQAA
ncbi:MAG: hypothetical protein AAGJ40_17600 [Planctomycetota bacterium]